MVNRPGWDEYFLGIAQAVAVRGDCRRSCVGAVLVRPDHTVASVGYNGTVPGEAGCLSGACPRAFSDAAPGSSYDSGPAGTQCIALHAEMNCLAFSRENTSCYTLYVTREPCGGCRRTMRAHRLTRAVWPEGEVSWGS